MSHFPPSRIGIHILPPLCLHVVSLCAFTKLAENLSHRWSDCEHQRVNDIHVHRETGGLDNHHLERAALLAGMAGGVVGELEYGEQVLLLSLIRLYVHTYHLFSSRVLCSSCPSVCGCRPMTQLVYCENTAELLPYPLL